MPSADNCNLHIPHKDWARRVPNIPADDAEREHNNYLTIERWAQHFYKNCGTGCEAAYHASSNVVMDDNEAGYIGIFDRWECEITKVLHSPPAPATTSRNFAYTGGYHEWTVPPDVETITVTLLGAQGGNASGLTGANGAELKCDVTVTPGEVLRIYVGEQGHDPTVEGDRLGGFNGGGNGFGVATFGAGGGGATDIRRTPYALADRLAVAGGGGGTGETISNNSGAGGANGGSGETGLGGGGGGGTQVAGGASGGGTATAGTLGVGGDGDGTAGSGGGGGYYGGGGGEANTSTNQGAGGGGSSLTTGVNSGITAAANEGHGSALIEYAPFTMLEDLHFAEVAKAGIYHYTISVDLAVDDDTNPFPRATVFFYKNNSLEMTRYAGFIPLFDDPNEFAGRAAIEISGDIRLEEGDKVGGMTHVRGSSAGGFTAFSLHLVHCDCAPPPTVPE